jgi:hypothetical protein
MTSRTTGGPPRLNRRRELHVSDAFPYRQPEAANETYPACKRRSRKWR